MAHHKCTRLLLGAHFWRCLIAICLLALSGCGSDPSSSILPPPVKAIDGEIPYDFPEKEIGDGTNEEIGGSEEIEEYESVSPDQGGESEFDRELRQLINAYRLQAGLSALELDPHLHDLAKEHSEIMEATQTMSHDGFKDRFDRSGYPTCVENVGWNYPTPEAMFEGWRNSPEHDENMRNGRIDWAGVSRIGAYITFFACGN